MAQRLTLRPDVRSIIFGRYNLANVVLRSWIKKGVPQRQIGDLPALSVSAI
jgi:hypothetical protein